MLVITRIGLALYLGLVLVAPTWGELITTGDVQFENNDVFIASEEDGTLTVTAPTFFESDLLHVAAGGTIGNLIIDGSEWIALQESNIGMEGTGNLTIKNGGSFSRNEGLLFVGYRGIGTFTVTGAGSSANLDSPGNTLRTIFGGAHGVRDGLARSELLVSDGAKLTTGNTTFGVSGSANVILEGGSSHWFHAERQVFSNAVLTIRDGAKLLDQSGNPSFAGAMFFGSEDGKTDVSITGDGSLLTAYSTPGIVIGAGGEAFVRVEKGADVIASRTSIGGSRYVNNQGFGSQGVLELDGPGTTWTTINLDFGSPQGKSELRITRGAVLNYTGTHPVILGEQPGSSAIVAIDGPNSRWKIPYGKLIVGSQGRGELRITGGASHQSKSAFVGGNVEGIVEVSGAGSAWEVQQSFEIQNGKLIIADGGEINARFLNLELTGQSEVVLDGGTLRVGNGTNSNGVVRGNRKVFGLFDNSQQGIIEVDHGEQLLFKELQNEGQIEIANGILRIDDQQLNSFNNGQNGQIRFHPGNNQLYGDHTSQGRVVIRENSEVTFFDNVWHDGIFSIADGSTAYFLDDFKSTSEARVLGDGRIVFEGGVDLAEIPATVEFGTDVTFAGSASWILDLVDEAHDTLVSRGTVNLGGELQIQLVTPLDETGVHELTIVEAESLQGEFDFLPEAGTFLGDHTIFQGIDYTDTSAVLVLEQLAPGDFNLDGIVDSGDLAQWQEDFGQNGWSDADGDGDSDGADFLAWQRQFGGSVTTPATVPEPAGRLTMVLLFGVLWLLSVRMSRFSRMIAYNNL